MKIDIPKFLRQLRILPVLIIVASLGFVVRLGDSYVSLKNMSGSAFAEEAAAPDAKPEGKPAAAVDTAAAPPKEGLKSSAEAEDEKSEGPDEIELPSTDAAIAAASGEANLTKKWQDASDSDREESTIKEEVFQDCGGR